MNYTNFNNTPNLAWKIGPECKDDFYLYLKQSSNIYIVTKIKDGAAGQCVLETVTVQAPIKNPHFIVTFEDVCDMFEKFEENTKALIKFEGRAEIFDKIISC